MVPMGDKGTVMVSSLGTWPISPERDINIRDDRLEQQLGVTGFVSPPSGSDDGKDIPVVRFPRMVSCPECKTLQDHSKFNIGSGENDCPLCEKSLIPSRFVIVCRRGHIDDFPYSLWIHGGREKSDSCTGSLRITNSSKTATLASISVSCESCGIQRTMEGSFNPSVTKDIFRCTGNTPWMPWADQFNCQSSPIVRQRGAASVWFPVTKSALSIPPWSHKFFTNIPESDLAAIEGILAMGEGVIPDKSLVVKSFFENKEYIAESGYSLEGFVNIILEHYADRTETEQTDLSMRIDEYKAILSGQEGTRGDRFISRGPIPLGNFTKGKVDNLMRLPVLTEIRALTGFARAELKSFDDRVDIRQSLNWLPAVEVKGEGIFLTLPEESVKEWENRDEVKRNFSDIEKSIPDNREIPVTPRLILLHSLAHVLIKQLAMDCGYPVTSLKERLYSDADMAGILIYTNGGDSAGSLGGLISQSSPEKFDRIFERALVEVGWCSHDPLCIETGGGVDTVNWGACQACLLLPEPSCEEMNSFLDRRSLVEGTSGTFFND